MANISCFDAQLSSGFLRIFVIVIMYLGPLHLGLPTIVYFF